MKEHTTTNDRLAKLLLALIACALWGFLLRPLITPAEAKGKHQSTQFTLPASAQVATVALSRPQQEGANWVTVPNGVLVIDTEEVPAGSGVVYERYVHVFDTSGNQIAEYPLDTHDH
jgi:hypothetical protein